MPRQGLRPILFGDVTRLVTILKNNEVNPRHMKKTLLIATFLFGLAALAGARPGTMLLNAAGATFPYPIYSKWFDVYHNWPPTRTCRSTTSRLAPGAESGSFRPARWTSARSDGPMTDEQLAQSKVKILHFPTVLGAVVPTYNIPGVSGDLNFTQKAMSGIYLGQITKWNDPEIAKANAGSETPQRRYRRRAPLRWQRHVVHFHGLPFEGQSRLEDESRH